MQKAEPLDNAILEMIPEKKFIIGYAGTIGLANALEYFLAAAKILEKNQEIAFLIVGDGKEKNNLLKMAKGMSNIYFIPAIPKRQIQSIIKIFDVCYIGMASLKS